MNPSQSIMNDQHRATARQWAWIKSLADRLPGHFTYSTIQELRDRVKALEATQHAHVDASHVIDPEREKAAQEMMQAAGFAPKWSEFKRCADSIDALNEAQPAQPIENWGEGHTLVDPPVYAQVKPNHPEIPDSSLVERVACAIYPDGSGDGFREEARAAIREVAAWMRKESSVHFDEGAFKLGETGLYWAQRLEQEANQ